MFIGFSFGFNSRFFASVIFASVFLWHGSSFGAPRTTFVERYVIAANQVFLGGQFTVNEPWVTKVVRGADTEAIKRQALSKTPVAKILKTGSHQGRYDIEVVRAVIMAGAEPYVTVYLAVAEGYPADEVIKAAIEEGLTVEKVLLAAINGGASEIDAAKSVTAMGVSPAHAADAIARITVPIKILP